MENSYLFSHKDQPDSGLVLRDRRKQLGITQEDLAYGICSVPKYSRIESGLERPSIQEFADLMERLQIKNACYNDFFSEPVLESHALLMQLQNAGVVAVVYYGIAHQFGALCPSWSFHVFLCIAGRHSLYESHAVT